MLCKKCGFEISEGDFCPNCGESNVSEVANTVKETSDPGKAKGIVALIMGILSLVNMCSCGTGIIFAIVGMILGSSGFKASEEAGYENKMAKIGKTLSIIGLILGIIGTIGVAAYLIFCFALGMGMGSMGY